MPAIWTKLPADDLIQRYAAGDSVLKLSRLYGVERGTIQRALREHGVKVRSGSEQQCIRQARMTPEERCELTKAANHAARGRKCSEEEISRKALTREARKLGTTPQEDELADLLRARGEVIRQQAAIGPYNCDLALAGDVAVEIFGGNFHFSGRHLRRSPKRLRYLLDRGWGVLILHLEKASSFTPPAADHVLAHVHELRGLPPRRRQYRMIRCAGELIAEGGAKDDDETIVRALRRGFKVTNRLR